MLCKHSFINGDNKRRCAKADIVCRYPFAPNSDKCEIAQEATAEEARRAGRIIRRFCVSRRKNKDCDDCPIYYICDLPPYLWEEQQNV